MATRQFFSSQHVFMAGNRIASTKMSLFCFSGEYYVVVCVSVFCVVLELMLALSMSISTLKTISISNPTITLISTSYTWLEKLFTFAKLNLFILG